MATGLDAHNQRTQSNSPGAAGGHLNPFKTVVIGNTSQSFPINHLLVLPYFQTLFSPRWHTSHNNNGPIHVLGQDTIQSKQLRFDCSDLLLLISTVIVGKISQKVDTNKIEQVLYCSDFFNAGNENQNDNDDNGKECKSKKSTRVTKVQLIEYFRNRRGDLSLHKDTRC